jgi:hypothetical protein
MPYGRAGYRCSSQGMHTSGTLHPVADLSQARIQRRPVLGGLLSEYERAA